MTPMDLIDQKKEINRLNDTNIACNFHSYFKTQKYQNKKTKRKCILPHLESPRTITHG